MTLFITRQTPTSAIIVTDTLVVNVDDKTPFKYTSKVRAFPHLNLVTSGSGLLRMQEHWAQVIDEGYGGCADIEQLNTIAPDELRRAWSRMLEQYGPQPGQRICNIGFPNGSDRIVMYMYESDNDFEPTRYDQDDIAYFQPSPRTFEQWLPDTAEDVIRLAYQLREDHPDLPIGGHLVATIIRNGQITTEVWHRFPEYEEQRLKILESCHDAPERRVVSPPAAHDGFQEQDRQGACQRPPRHQRERGRA